MKPEISIIVPCYKVENYIEKCVDSILDQTFRDFELILVDDGSPDNCPAICDRYAAQDPRVKVIHKTNGGLSDARNYGLNIAEGRYIGFVDSDDWIAGDMFESLYQAIRSQDADIAVCCHYEVSDGVFNRINSFDGFPVVLDNVKAMSELLIDQRIQNLAWDKLYRRELFRGVAYPVGVAFEDIPTTYKLFMKAEKIAIVDKPLYYYLKRTESISGTYDLKKRLDKFNGTYEKYTRVKDHYADAIDKPTWDWFTYRMVDEGMGIYNHLLREKLETGDRRELGTIKAFMRENLNSILTAKTIGIQLKAAALILATNKMLYSLFYNAVISRLRREKNESFS